MIDPPTWLTLPPPFAGVVVGVDSSASIRLSCAALKMVMKCCASGERLGRAVARFWRVLPWSRRR